MLLSKIVVVKWNIKNKKYYESLGYTFTKNGESFEVPVENLLPNSKVFVDVLCDFCKQKIVRKKYQTYKQQHHPKYGDCCVECQPLKNKLCCLDKYGVDNGAKTIASKEKTKQTSLEKYGVDNPSKADFVREKLSDISRKNAAANYEKAQNTCFERYGVFNAMESPEIKERQQKSVFEKYGVYHPKQNEDVKRKERERHLEKYGCQYSSQREEVKEKVKATCLRKYGNEYYLGSKEAREKISKTLLQNGLIATSKQQIKVQEMLTDLYGNCELNFPCGSCFLDCMVMVNNIKIDVEYDGLYWHQDKQRDRKRDEFVKSQGYKVLRILGGKALPTKEEIIDKINLLTTTNTKFTQINLV